MDTFCLTLALLFANRKYAVDKATMADIESIKGHEPLDQIIIRRYKEIARLQCILIVDFDVPLGRNNIRPCFEFVEIRMEVLLSEQQLRKA